MIRHACAIGVACCLGLDSATVLAQNASAPPPAPRSIAKTLVDDLKSMANVDTFPLGLATATAAMVLWPYDHQLTVHASSSPFLKKSFDGWARVGGQEWLLASAAIGTYAVGRVLERPTVTQVGRDLIEGEVIAGTFTLGVKLAVHRTRPDGEPRSFPSGHAAGTFAAAAVLQRHFGWRAAVPAYSFAAVISSARLQANSHYPTDVIVGAGIGILSGHAATFELGPRHVRLYPAAVRGGFGFSGSVH
jgi:membrane-associated phospholipid phosphatase